MQNKAHNNSVGFTLIETLVAIIVLVAAVVGPLGLVADSLFSSFAARDQVTASFLAQEGIEIMRHRRDNSILGGNPAFSGTSFNTCINSTDGCKVASGHVSSCTGSCEFLLYDDSTGRYQYLSGDPTPFRRTVMVTPISAPDEYLVEVIVEWKTRSLDRSFTVREIMYNWPHL